MQKQCVCGRTVERASQCVCGVDHYHLGMILHTSVENANYYIAKANLVTLRTALETEKVQRKRKTLIGRLERRISRLEREEAAV